MRHEQAPLFCKFYDLTGWLLDRTEGFPKSQRFVFGQRLGNHALDILQSTVKALYTSKPIGLLERMNRELEVLRVLVRLCKDRKLLAVRQYEYASREINECGRMIGGWIRHIRGEEAK